MSYFAIDNFSEPTLEELFAEPIVQLVMQRDGVRVREMRRQFERLGERRTYRRSVQ